jgi:hypothetical protein
MIPHFVQPEKGSLRGETAVLPRFRTNDKVATNGCVIS